MCPVRSVKKTYGHSNAHLPRCSRLTPNLTNVSREPTPPHFDISHSPAQNLQAVIPIRYKRQEPSRRESELELGSRGSEPKSAPTVLFVSIPIPSKILQPLLPR